MPRAIRAAIDRIRPILLWAGSLVRPTIAAGSGREEAAAMCFPGRQISGWSPAIMGKRPRRQARIRPVLGRYFGLGAGEPLGMLLLWLREQGAFTLDPAFGGRLVF